MGQPDFSDGSMIALYPPPDAATALAIPGGLPPDELHLTIAYTGKAADTSRKQLRAAVRALADRDQFPATISGHARLTSDPRQDVIVALVDAPQLDDLRSDAYSELGQRGIEPASDHSALHHITLAYIGKDDPDPVVRLNPRKIAFTAVTATHGGSRQAHDFDTGLAEAARQAYTAGWALTGQPVTETARQGCGAAIHTALLHAGDVHVLEATLQVGKLHGTWARIFDRREQIIGEHVKKVAEAWSAITSSIDATPAIRTLLAEAGRLHETDGWTRSISEAAAANLLSGLYAHDKHHLLQNAVQDAIRAGMADGRTAAMALRAEKAGRELAETITDDPFSWSLTYQQVYDQLEHLPELPLMAQAWIQRMIQGAARSIGVLLARLLEAGASRADMADEVVAALTATTDATPSARAVTAFVDQAVSQAYSQASLDLYQSEGTEQAWFVTAGDDRVDQECRDAENNSPYPPAQCPVPGLHPGCRCVVTGDDPAPFKALVANL